MTDQYACPLPHALQVGLWSPGNKYSKHAMNNNFTRTSEKLESTQTQTSIKKKMARESLPWWVISMENHPPSKGQSVAIHERSHEPCRHNVKWKKPGTEKCVHGPISMWFRTRTPLWWQGEANAYSWQENPDGRGCMLLFCVDPKASCTLGELSATELYPQLSFQRLL